MLVRRSSEGGLVPLNLVGVEVYQILFARQFIHFMLRIFFCHTLARFYRNAQSHASNAQDMSIRKNDLSNWLKERVHEAQ